MSMSQTSNNPEERDDVDHAALRNDEGGLYAPSRLHGWQKTWWWFHFLILVNLARLRFVAILAVIGLIIMKEDMPSAYYARGTRPASAAEDRGLDTEYFCPMHPSVI